MNQHGSRKVLQWKLDIQHYNAIIEHVPGKANIPADIFSRQIIKAPTLPLFHILTLHCSTEQRELIHKYHTHLYAHYGVERTIALLTQYEPILTSRRKLAQPSPRCPPIRSRLPNMSKDGCTP
jgi:hypothetical protein